MENIDVNQELKIIENALRDIISFALNIKYGHNWIDNLKVSEDKKKSWNDKMIEETKRQKGVLIDNRPLYYSEFRDLCNIISNHWDDVFKEVFKEKKQTEVLLDLISSYRTSIAHNRELKSYQKHLLVGASGTLRHFATEYKADRDNADSYYPKFENIIINDLDIINLSDSVKLYDKVYHVGDEIEVAVNVICPPDVKVKYAIEISSEPLFTISDKHYSSTNTKKFKLEETNIPSITLYVYVKTDKSYHRYGNNRWDLAQKRRIDVLP